MQSVVVVAAWMRIPLGEILSMKPQNGLEGIPTPFPLLSPGAKPTGVCVAPKGDSHGSLLHEVPWELQMTLVVDEQGRQKVPLHRTAHPKLQCISSQVIIHA